MGLYTISEDGVPLRSSGVVVGDAKDYVSLLDQTRLGIEAFNQGKPPPVFVKTNILGLFPKGTPVEAWVDVNDFSKARTPIGNGYIATKFLISQEEEKPSTPVTKKDDGPGAGTVVIVGLGALFLYYLSKGA